MKKHFCTPEEVREIFRETIFAHIPAKHYVISWEEDTSVLAWRDPIDGKLSFIADCGYVSASGYVALDRRSPKGMAEKVHEILQEDVTSRVNVHPNDVTVRPKEIDYQISDRAWDHDRSATERSWEPRREPLPEAAQCIVDRFCSRIDASAVMTLGMTFAFGYDPDDGQLREVSYASLAAVTGEGRDIFTGWHYLLRTPANGAIPPRRPGEDAVHHAGRIWNDATRRRGQDPTPELLEALRRVRGALVSSDYGASLLYNAVEMLTDLPPEWWPPPLADAPEEWEALGTIALKVNYFAEATGRRPRDLIGAYAGSWSVTLRSLVGALEISISEAGEIMDNIQYHLDDMLQAFERQVMWPALWREGWRPGSGRHTPLDHADPMRCASIRLLLGQKKLPAFFELSLRWSSEVTAIAEAELELACAEGMSWDLSMNAESLPLADGGAIEIRPLASAQEFLDEGRAGPDSDGIVGLNHCVASYLPKVRSGHAAIVSVRARASDGTVTRLSTAELSRHRSEEDNAYKLACEQHRGFGNAEPSRDAEAALAGYVDRLNRRLKAGEVGVLDGGLFQPVQLGDNNDVRNSHPWIYDPDAGGSVEAILEKWHFALARGHRVLSPEQLLLAAGLDVEVLPRGVFLPRVRVPTGTIDHSGAHGMR